VVSNQDVVSLKPKKHEAKFSEHVDLQLSVFVPMGRLWSQVNKYSGV